MADGRPSLKKDVNVCEAILALSGRSDPDSRGDRPYVLYLSLVSYIALFTALFAVVDLASTAMVGIRGVGQEIPHL